MPYGPDLEPIERTGGGEASKGVLSARHGTFRLTDCPTPLSWALPVFCGQETWLHPSHPWASFIHSATIRACLDKLCAGN